MANHPKRIVAALNNLLDLGIGTGQPHRLATKTAWLSPVYERWLKFAREEATRVSTDTTTIEPAAVEVSLLRYGRKLVLG